MTDPLDSTEQIPANEPEIVADNPAVRNEGRFSPLFVGLTFAAALFLGAAIGYGFGRSQSEPPVQVVVTATPGRAVAQAGSNQTQAVEQPDPDAEPESPIGQPTATIMDFVLSDARHFQGSADAPVTLIEFSDFK